MNSPTNQQKKALRKLKLAVYTPLIFSTILLILGFLAQTSKIFPDFNKLFDIMPPLITVASTLLIFGINTWLCLIAYTKTIAKSTKPKA